MKDHPGAIYKFVRELRASGAPRLSYTSPDHPLEVLREMEEEAAEDPKLTSFLQKWHAEAAEDLGGPPLTFDEKAARFGLQSLFRAGWCYLHRDTTPEEVAELLHADLPSLDHADALFSADLTLQHLPALFRMARRLSPNDPLIPAVRVVGAQVPLSSVGIPTISRADPPVADPAAWAAMRGHSGLWQLFLDRIVIRQGWEWLAFSTVSSALADSLGEYQGDLAPGLDLVSVGP